MGVGCGGVPLPWIFIHGSNIVDRDIKVLFFGVILLFFGLFLVPPPGRDLIVLFFGLFSVGPHGNFSADVLDVTFRN